MIKITCKECGKILEAPEEAAGKKGKCPECGSVFVVPDADRGGRKCPGCRVVYPAETVICTYCGINLDTGQKLSVVANTTDAASGQDVSDMQKELHGWGIGLIAIGFISIFLIDFLDPGWGVVLIVLGILSLAVKKRGMFIAIGAGLLLVGLMNIGIGSESGSTGWVIFGILQLYWGVQEIRKFKKYGIAG